MGKGIPVPITPAVLKWAIRESGYTEGRVAEKIGIALSELGDWLGEVRHPPTLTQVRKLAALLKRTPSTFLLPAAPEPTALAVQFRHPADADRTSLNSDERRYLREAARLQEAVKWIIPKLGEPSAKLLTSSLEASAEQVAQVARQRLRPYLTTSLRDWKTHAQAFNAWRATLEASGVLVFLFPLGKESAEGFSLWEEDSPLIAVNTAWNHAARIYTLFHEYGHLLTRTSSVCLERSSPHHLSKPTDRAERWCEEFAAAVLLPWGPVSEFLKSRFNWRPGVEVNDLDVPRAISTTFKVSLRAATIRLIKREAAPWDLYAQIPPYTDQKHGGGAGEGRDRGQIREDQYGDRTVNLFVRALDRRILGRADVLDYLDVTDSGLSRLQGVTVSESD